MIPANLSIFREDYAPRSTRVVPTADGSASVYSALAVGRIVGQGRTIPALVCEEIGTEDKWHVINMYVAGGYMGTVAVLGATSGEQAGEWVGRQILPYLSGGQSSYCACDGVASAEALQAVLDSAATSVIRLPIRQKDIDTFEGRITDNPVVWDNDALQSHTAAELIHELAKHDREGQMMDAMCKDDLPKVVSQYDGIFALFDALIVDYNRLGLMQDRLFAAMHKANVGSVKPLTVTPTKPFKRNGVTNVAVLFEMDDGQTVTIIFHSPDATPAKLGPKDTLTSWKWLLNKRDVTVAVAPDNGENVQLPALARRILLLVEKNSARFKRTNVKKAEQMQDLADTTSRVEQKTAALDGLNAEIEGLQKQIDAGVAAPAPVAAPAAKQAPEDGRLTPETAGNMKNGDIVKTADGTEYMAMGARHDWLEVAPIVNGKAQVNNQDTFKFLLTPEKASAYPERRTDAVYPTGRNYYADNESAKANMAKQSQQQGDLLGGAQAQAAKSDWRKTLYAKEVADGVWRMAGINNGNPVSPSYFSKEEAEAAQDAFANTGDYPAANPNNAPPESSDSSSMTTDKRPENWRTDKDAAIAIASSMGIDTKGMQLKKIVTAIETKDRELRVDAAADLIDDVLADVKVPEGFGIVFDKMREIKDAYNGSGTLSGYIILQDVSGISADSLSEIEVRVAVSRPGQRESATGYIFEMTGPNRGFPRKKSSGHGAFTANDDSIEGLRAMFADRLEKSFAFYAENDTREAPTYAPEPDATAMTPKQYHEAKLAKIASDSGASMSEVRENYDNEAERKANDSKWVEAVRQAAKEGKTISRATLDKMDEIRPGAVGSLMHDYPDADIPNGYQLPGARKSEAASKPNKKFDGYIMTAADSLDKLRLSDIDRVLDQAATKDEMLQLATYMVSRRPGIRDHVLQSFKDVLIENGWNKAFREVPNAPKEIPTNSTDAVKHLKRLFNVLEKAGVKVGLRPDDRKTLRFSVVTAGKDTVSGQMSMGYVLSGDPSWSVDGIRLSPITNQAEKTVLKIMQDAALWLNGEKIDFKSDAFSEDKTWAANSPLGAKWQADIVDAARSASEVSQEPAAAPAAPAQPAAPASDPDADLLNAIISGTTSAADVDMDALIAIAEKYDGKPEMEGLVNQALEVVTQYELDAAKAIG